METQQQIDELKKYMMELAYEGSRTERSVNMLSQEMKEFKEEMREFKDEMKEFKDEMKEFKDEMRVFKEETRREQINRNKQWGELANKMGTIVEDIILPAVGPVLEKYFQCEIESILARVKKRNKALNLRSEFDVIATSEEQVFLIETKSSPNAEYLQQFIEKQDLFRKLFPEYSDKKLVLIFSGIRMDPEVVSLCTSKNVYAMAYREWDYMDLLNFKEIAEK